SVGNGLQAIRTQCDEDGYDSCNTCSLWISDVGNVSEDAQLSLKLCNRVIKSCSSLGESKTAGEVGAVLLSGSKLSLSRAAEVANSPAFLVSSFECKFNSSVRRAEHVASSGLKYSEV